MEEPAHPTAANSLLRSRSRRAFLAGAAGIAVAGATGALVYAGGESDSKSRLVLPGIASDPPIPVTESSPTPAPASAAAEVTPIEDPLRRAAHLLRRAGFGGNAAQIEEFAQLSREEAADRLLDFEAIDNSVLDARLAKKKFELLDYQNGLAVDMQRWWLTRMAYSARPLEERMTFIWHGLLTSQLSKIGPLRGKLMVRQNELFRSMALPKYDELLKAVSRDPAMLLYLDNADSTKAHPNENYARELMELFSIGVGNYTEDDVREAARAFTGWRITPPQRSADRGITLTDEERREALRAASLAYEPEFYIAAMHHDNGEKTFMRQTGNFGGDEIIDIIMQQPATSRRMCTRLFQEFVRYEPDEETILSLIDTWESTHFDVRAVVRQILVSDAFYSETSYRALVRTPVEFVVGLVRALELETDFRTLITRQAGMQTMNQVLFEPLSVAGWPKGGAWLSSGTFFGRVNFADALLYGAGRGGSRSIPAIPAIPALSSAANAEATVDLTLERLVDGQVAEGTREALYTYARSIANSAERAAAVAYLVAASPEFQLA